VQAALTKHCIPYYAFLFIRKASRTSNRRGQKIISRTKVIIGLTIVDSPSLAVVVSFSLDVDVHGKISLIIIDTGSSYHSELREQIARETVLLDDSATRDQVHLFPRLRISRNASLIPIACANWRDVDTRSAVASDSEKYARNMHEIRRDRDT